MLLSLSNSFVRKKKKTPNKSCSGFIKSRVCPVKCALAACLCSRPQGQGDGSRDSWRRWVMFSRPGEDVTGWEKLAAASGRKRRLTKRLTRESRQTLGCRSRKHATSPPSTRVLCLQPRPETFLLPSEEKTGAEVSTSKITRETHGRAEKRLVPMKLADTRPG